MVRRGGFDATGKPVPWLFDSVACTRFMVTYWEREGFESVTRNRYLKQLHPADPRYHVAEAQAERLNRLHDREAAGTVAKADAVAIADQIFGMIRAHFGKLPGAITASLAPLGATGEKAEKIERFIRREVKSALSGMDAGAITDVRESESACDETEVF